MPITYDIKTDSFYNQGIQEGNPKRKGQSTFSGSGLWQCSLKNLFLKNVRFFANKIRSLPVRRGVEYLGLNRKEAQRIPPYRLSRHRLAAYRMLSPLMAGSGRHTQARGASQSSVFPL